MWNFLKKLKCDFSKDFFAEILFNAKVDMTQLSAELLMYLFNCSVLVLKITMSSYPTRPSDLPFLLQNNFAVFLVDSCGVSSFFFFFLLKQNYAISLVSVCICTTAWDIHYQNGSFSDKMENSEHMKL